MPEVVMETYDTHVGLRLRRVDGRVTIEGDNVKVIYEGIDIAKAKDEFAYAKEHYEQRRIALDALGEAAERDVPYVRRPEGQ